MPTRVAVRCRLQQLEGNQAHLAMDLQSMKGMGALMVGWRDQMETASAHLAAVLGLVERDGKAVRYVLLSCIWCPT